MDRYGEPALLDVSDLRGRVIDEYASFSRSFLLVAHLDALFDRGLITFDAHGDMVIAACLSSDHRALLHLDEVLRLRWVAPEHLTFLLWHRNHVFRG